MGSTAEFRKKFVARLKEACDQNKSIPAQGQGRQMHIAREMHVTVEAVSKWFRGVSLPTPDKIQELAELLNVDQAWLHQGVTATVDRMERRRQQRETSAAAHIVFGMIQLAGGYCGEPAEMDERASYVDFYANVRGKVYPIHVALGKEQEDGSFEVIVPKEYANVRIITVIPQDGGRMYFIEMPREEIERHKTRKQGAFAVHLEREAGARGDSARFVTGDFTWPRIRSFEEFS